MVFEETGYAALFVLALIIAIVATVMLCGNIGSFQFPYVMTVTDANNNTYTGTVCMKISTVIITIDDEKDSEVSIPLEIVKKIEAVE